MKTLKTILLLLIISNYSLSQTYRDIELEYETPISDTVTGVSFSYKIKITNNSDTVIPGFTNFGLWFNINGMIYALDGTANQKTIGGYGGPILPDSSIVLANNFYSSFINNIYKYNSVCFHIQFDSASGFIDTITNNNSDCFIFQYTNFISVVENKIKDNFKITNSNSLINIESKLNESYQYHLFSMSGKLIKTEQSFEDKRINVSHLKRGMYFIRITNNTSSFSKKVMIR